MKNITFHYVGMHTVRVPDECPENSYSEMLEFIVNNIDHNFDGTQDEKHTIVDKADTRDWEIVDVIPIQPLKPV